MFFIAHRVPGTTASEWYLVRVDLDSTISANPNAMQDGRFLVEFYVGHPADKRYNAINQRFWLEYHPIIDMANPFRNRTTHLIRPSDQSQAYAAKERLRPFRQWARLNHSDTYISGPFDFAVINGRKPEIEFLRNNGRFYTSIVTCLQMKFQVCSCQITVCTATTSIVLLKIRRLLIE